MSNPPSGLATPSSPSHHPSLHTSRYKAGFAATDWDWMGHVDGPGCQSPGVHVFHGHMFHIVLSAYKFNIDINTHEVFIDEILWLSCQTASAPSSRTKASVELFFLDTGLYIRSSMLENRKEASPYDYLRDIRYSQCCSPLCNNLTLLLSQASWSLRLGSAIKETCKMNMAHLCPCTRDRQKTGEPQRYLPLLS